MKVSVSSYGRMVIITNICVFFAPPLNELKLSNELFYLLIIGDECNPFTRIQLTQNWLPKSRRANLCVGQIQWQLFFSPFVIDNERKYYDMAAIANRSQL